MISDAEASPKELTPELLKKNICFLFYCFFSEVLGQLPSLLGLTDTVVA